MRHKRALLLAVALATCLVSPMLWAQADARKAFEDGRAAWTAGEFTRARDLFLAASRTDARNPEVFLWLGKAQYQLGELTEAVAAWRRTLALAPDEPYAAGMLAALSGEMRDVDLRIRLIEALLREKLNDAALKQCTDLLRETAPTDAQRASVMLLLARAQLASGRGADALETVNRLVVRYPALVDEAETTLVTARARLAQGGEGIAEAVGLFGKVVADHPNTPSAAAARFHLLQIDLTERPTAARVKTLEDWIAANPAHEQVDDARRLLVTSLLKLTELSGPPRKDAPLSATDVAALRVALELLKQTANVTESAKLTKQLINYLEYRYAAVGAHQAAIDGARQLLSAPLPFACRLEVLQHLRGFQALAADAYLDGLAKSGTPVPPGAVPQVVADVLETIRTIRTEFPEETATWLDQALLAQSLGKLAAQTPWPARVDALKPPMQWALEIALPVIAADANEQAVPRAFAVVGEIVQSCRTLGGVTALELALSVNTRLQSTVSPRRPEWRRAAGTQLELLDALARAVFTENVRLGRDDLNAKVSEPQQRYLAVLATLQREDPAEAAGLLKQLNAHLKGWVAHGHYETAQTMLEELAKSLPLKEQREAQLEVARLWVR
ncbi:MAG TPA: tetratricopeptide repeat protein, partial [Planctomycetota bacterium]|nr:tetratricopeptide repeat protein [Planctomycetota bacterium]